MTTPILIDNFVVRATRSGRGSIVEPVRSYRRCHPGVNVREFPRITLGHRLLDNRLLQHIMEGNIVAADLLDIDAVEALPFPLGEPPIVMHPVHPHYMILYTNAPFVLK